jgi:ubiquinone/menaquinone biosynthesis C-methylase UbiE
MSEPFLIDRLAPQAGERILDLGCGPGLHAARIAAAGAHVVGIDIDPEMIALARARCPELRFEVGDAQEIPLDGPFDAVYCNSVLHWIKEPERVIASVHRVLRPGGRFLAEFGRRGGLRTIVAAFEDAARAFGCGPWESPYYFPTTGEYATLLEREGFEVFLAVQFDRPENIGGEAGLWDCIRSFHDLIDRVPPDRQEAFYRQIGERLRSFFCREGVWDTDYYRHLQVVALRADGLVTEVGRT